MDELNIGKWRSLALYVLVVLFLVFEMAVQVSPSVMTGQLMGDLHLSTFGLGLMSGFYFYTYTAMQIPSGILLDRFSPRWVISTSILICSLGALAFGLSTNIYIGCLARLLMGVGSAFAFVSVLVVTSDLFHNRYFALFTGITQMLAAFGAMAGQLPLSKLVFILGWRHTMFVLVAIGLCLSGLVWSSVRYEKPAVQEDVEQRSEGGIRRDLLDILRNRQTWMIAIYACMLWAPMSGFASLWGVPFLMAAHHLTHASAATLCSLMWLGLAVFSPILGWGSTKMNSRVIPLACVAFLGVVAFSFVLFYAPLSSVWMLGLFLCLAGAACAGQALSFSAVKENNSSAQRATAISFNNMAVVISGAVVQPLIGKVLQMNGSGVLHHHMIYSLPIFRDSLLVILVCYAIGLLVALTCIRETLGEGFSALGWIGQVLFRSRANVDSEGWRSMDYFLHSIKGKQSCLF